MNNPVKKNPPKYAVIANDLILKIKSGELPTGAELPSESDLINLYNVSRVTVRRAIDELYHEGYIEKMQGKRTCVRGAAKLQELAYVSGYTEEIIRQGMKPGRKILKSELRICTTEEAEKLQLKKADPVFHLKRIYYADDRPLCLTDAVLPYQICRDIETYDFEENSLYKVLEKNYKIGITTTALKLKAISAYDELAEYLDVSQDTPLLHSMGLTYGKCGDKEIPIELFTNYYLTTQFEYSLIQTRR